MCFSLLIFVDLNKEASSFWSVFFFLCPYTFVLVEVKEMKTVKQIMELVQFGDIPSISLINYHSFRICNSVVFHSFVGLYGVPLNRRWTSTEESVNYIESKSGIKHAGLNRNCWPFKAPCMTKNVWKTTFWP